MGVASVKYQPHMKESFDAVVTRHGVDSEDPDELIRFLKNQRTSEHIHMDLEESNSRYMTRL